MTATALSFTSTHKDWPSAFRAVRRLLSDPSDTVQVFRVMAALNSGTAKKNYHRLLATREGGRVAYKREELVSRLTDPAFLAGFAPGTVGAAYRDFLSHTGFSADGLATVSRQVEFGREDEHPYAWFGRRERDIHDIWHVLTGYAAEDPLGELCLVAFSYAQSRGLGWAFIALMGTLKSLSETRGLLVARAVWEGYRHGRAAKWLHAEDIDALFAEQLDEAPKRLNIAEPAAYHKARQKIGAERLASYMKAAA